MTAEPSVLCPMCGSEARADAESCSICGYALVASNNEGGVKCARCGSGVPAGYAFCPVCGLDQRHRLARPHTRVVQIEDEDEEPVGGGAGGMASPEAGGWAQGAEERAGFPHPNAALMDPPVAYFPPAGAPNAGASPGQPYPAISPAPLHSRQVHDDDRTIPVPSQGHSPSVLAPAAPSPELTPDPWGAERIASAGSGLAHVVLVGRDGEEGEQFTMHRAMLEIGRTHGDMRFPEDRFMSPAHARLEREGAAFRLVDLSSHNGVFLRIRGHAAVYPGDLFMVGHQVLRLENVTESVQEHAPAPDGTRYFGTPLKPAWGKLTLVGRGAVPGDVYFLRGAKVVFGREQGDILFPHDPFVSREHARLRLELHGHQMSVFVEDLGSANGTYVRVRGSTDIRPRDTFRIGDQILRLRLDG